MLEQFARLNAKTASFQSSGIAPLLEVTDLCGVLASLPEQHSWYIYAMIEQRRAHNMDLLHRYIQQLVLQEMYRKELKLRIVTSKDFAYGVTKAALYAHFNPKGKCKACNGLGFKAAKPCNKCDGNGAYEHNWSEKVEYGFPLRKDLSRKWYQQSCGPYDNYVTSILIDIQIDLSEKLYQVKQQAKRFKYMESESLFDEL